MRKWFVLLCAAGALLAQSEQKLPNEQWEQLFNGKDLTNWVPVGVESWVVDGGSIHGQAVSKEYGYLKTAKKYKDFELAIRFKCEGPGNSGVFVHSEFVGNTPEISQGVQFEIDQHIGNHTGGLYGDGRGWIAWPAPEFETILRPNDWNDYHLKVEGNRYIARLNGVLIIDFTDPNPKSFDGSIALQLHAGGGGAMRFKDIYIRDFSRR